MITNKRLSDAYTNVLVANGPTKIVNMIFCNTTESESTLTCSVLPAGGTASDDNAILKDLAIGAKNTFVWEVSESLRMDNGDVIAALSDTDDAITVTVNSEI